MDSELRNDETTGDEDYTDAQSQVEETTSKDNLGYDCDGDSEIVFKDLKPRLSKVSIPIDAIEYVSSSAPSSRSSSQMSNKNAPIAVSVRNGVKRYGKGNPILNDFSMTVKQHTIYSLLGSSGCGKTTLLSCVIGIKKLQEGSIHVFGCKPGTRESGVPGKRVGYMPQDIALYSNFSITESLNYFGALYGMEVSEVATNRDFFIEFLNLPDPNRQIGNLSGGQKRRVSLAVALIHSPELLILDEPTVGVDPLLRDSIWNHLVKLVTSLTTTVIITTHYIEEARQSNTIGLMRNGRLLTEKNPEALCQQYNTTILEDIVLQICKKDGTDKPNGEPQRHDDKQLGRSATYFRQESQRRQSILPFAPDLEDKGEFWESVNRLKALIAKNIVVTMRNFFLVIFMVLTPGLSVIAFCISIGNDVKGLDVGVVNHDANYSSTCLRLKNLSTSGCDVDNLSCKYLARLPTDIINLHEYWTIEEAQKGIRDGDIRGFIFFPDNFSTHFYTRATSGGISVDNDTVSGSRLPFQLEMSNKQVTGAIRMQFEGGIQKFIEQLLIDCGISPAIVEPHLKFSSSGHADEDTDFRQYVSPSIMLGLLFFFPMVSNGVTYIREKKQGTLERSMVAGVQNWEIMVSMATTEGIVLLLQTSSVVFIITVIYGFDIHGSVPLVFIISIAIGLAGLSCGFLISSLCDEEVEAVMLCVAGYIPNFLLAGMIWPLEGQPAALQTIVSIFLPCTLASEAIRSIITRGWSLSHDHVWPGFVSVFSWILVYWILTIGIHKFRASRK